MIVWCAASLRRCWKLISRLTFIILCQSTGWLFAAFSDFSFWHDSLKTSITRRHYLSILKLPLCLLFSLHCLSFSNIASSILCVLLCIFMTFLPYMPFLWRNTSEVTGENRQKNIPKHRVSLPQSGTSLNDRGRKRQGGEIERERSPAERSDRDGCKLH